MKATPYNPKIVPPVASVENVLLHASDMVMINRLSR
ncbi:MAG: hypothetical protein HW378_1870 [Anaerolineales bacterium]|nr:hypothetical protein [Anaerolineales bacterium]